LVGYFKQLKPKILQLAGIIEESDPEEKKPEPNARSTRNKNNTTRQNGKKEIRNASGRLSNSDAGAIKRIPVVSYNFLKDKQLTQLLSSVGLSKIPYRSRDDMIAAHKEVQIAFVYLKYFFFLNQMYCSMYF